MVATGPWLNQLLRPLGLEQPIESAMSQTSVFRGTGWDARPCLIEWDLHGTEAAYGLPVAGSGYKVGLQHHDELDPGRRGAPARPHGGPGARGPRRRPLHRARPAAGAHRALPTTYTPDGHFLLDRRGATVVAGACSGHGFMFSPALGEVIADLAEGARSPELFRIDRPGRATARVIS